MGIMATGNPSFISEASTGRIVLSKSLASSFGITGPSGNTKAEREAVLGADAAAFAAKAGASEAVIAEINKINNNEEQTDSEPQESKYSIDKFVTLLSGGSTDNIWSLNDDNSGKNLKAAFGTNSSVDAHNRLCQNASYDKQSQVTTNDKGGIEGVFGTSINNWGTNGTATNETSVQIARKGMSIEDLYNSASDFSSSLFLGAIGNAGNKWSDAPNSWTEAINNFGAFVEGVSAKVMSGIKTMGLNTAAKDMVTSIKQNMYNTWSGNKKWDSAFFKQVASEKGYAWNDQGFNHSEDALGAALMACKGVAGIVCAADEGDGYCFAVDAGKFVKDFINTVMKELTGGQCFDNNTVNQDNQWNTSESYTISTKYTVADKTDSSTPVSSDANVNRANYYMKMYDQLIGNGWVIDDSVNNASTLNEKLVNQQYYVNGGEALNSGMYEEDKSENEKKAERYYEDEMRKINNKEKKLEKELTKLQTEYSSLTTDYESVKSIITANIGKSFTYCQNG